MTVHHLPRGEVHVARAEQVYPLLAPGSVRLVISDGPYGMQKAAWDRQRTADDLRAWYAPHVEAWGRVCMEAASVYLWGTAQSVRALQPLMEAHGWTWRVAVTWDRVCGFFSVAPSAIATWADQTETCDVWVRGRAPFNRPSPGGNVWRLQAAGGGSPMAGERLRSGVTRPARALTGSPWREPLHPCQKPLTFYDRIIRASSRPGDLVLEPFGGTLRAAAACEAMPAHEARRYVCAEPDEDGRGYVPAALAAIRAAPVRLL